MAHRSSSHRVRYLSLPGIGLTLFVLFILYGLLKQPEAFTDGLSKIGSWLAYGADWVLWLMGQTPDAA